MQRVRAAIDRDRPRPSASLPGRERGLTTRTANGRRASRLWVALQPAPVANVSPDGWKPLGPVHVGHVGRQRRRRAVEPLAADAQPSLNRAEAAEPRRDRAVGRDLGPDGAVGSRRRPACLRLERDADRPVAVVEAFGRHVIASERHRGRRVTASTHGDQPVALALTLGTDVDKHGALPHRREGLPGRNPV